ncbi:MAG TPA: hypothetical protein VFY36_01420 [Solirubrobacteraceae bacterium]|nr:hypothetical protein [Solirubrobacteraceae bacterium]
MLKQRLLHPLGEGRHTRRHRRRRGAPVAEPTVIAAEALVQPSASSTVTAAEHVPDPDVQRVQEAGGPVDHASYSCACGYLFSADVSTSVTCPHCGTGQAW